MNADNHRTALKGLMRDYLCGTRYSVLLEALRDVHCDNWTARHWSTGRLIDCTDPRCKCVLRTASPTS